MRSAFFLGGGYIRKAFLPDFQKLSEIFRTYSARIFMRESSLAKTCSTE